jgi:hypothetical protein
MLVGDTGRIVKPQDSGALAANCQDLILAGREERMRLGTAARTRIIVRFSIASVARLYESLYQHIIAEGTLKEFAEANLSDKLSATGMPANHEQVFTLRPQLARNARVN